ncbi:hypothetical protein [Actinoplanes sichuanensis]|uniref:Uncharacterized protein n=1 Tax=Actinoplanes sichuanensis TaxID=512349 RepID=A0ABW4AJH9_9ACTN|nr:hypothetical protein [Actinoplanes sichuanensis]
MSKSHQPRRSARHSWWQTLLDAAPALLDLPGTIGDLAGEVSASVLDDLADSRFLNGGRRHRPDRHRDADPGR